MIAVDTNLLVYAHRDFGRFPQLRTENPLVG